MPKGRLFKVDHSKESLFILKSSNFSEAFGLHWMSQFYALLDNSMRHTGHFVIPGGSAIQDVWVCLSNYAGAIYFWLSKGSPFFAKPSIDNNHFSHLRNHLLDLHVGFGSNVESAVQVLFSKVSESALKCLKKGVEVQVLPMLSLAATFLPPENLSSETLLESMPVSNTDERIDVLIDQFHNERDHRGCSTLVTTKLTWMEDAIEPKTGIKFPTILGNIQEDDCNLTTEVLVGTGSRTMRVIKIKSLKVYAFGLYVHPYSICQKLGAKYASVPTSELKDRLDFFDDLLREDIHMTVRLVVNCGGLKISTVRDTFEKALRTRLQKMNPETDFHCLSTFGSYFTQDIPLPVGTTISFRQTADGRLITEVEGKQIGAVQSKDLCRAFFDMYIGEVPVSAHTKQEIAQNVASIIRRC